MSTTLNILSLTEDTDAILSGLYQSRDLLLGAAKDYASDALLAAVEALEGANDGALCAELYQFIRDARERRDKALEAIEGVNVLTEMICGSQETGDEDADDAFAFFQSQCVRITDIVALVEGVDRRIDTVLALLPDDPRPGARCA